MRMRAAMVTGMVAAVVFSFGAPVQAQDQAQDQVQVQQRPQRPAAPGGATRPGPAPGQPRRPVRDPRQPPAEGTATVRGRVVDGLTGQALPRAKVRMNGRDPRSSRVATTDAEGGFTLTKVPAGPLMLQAEKATYLPGSFPDRRRTMRASSVNLAEGQTVDNVTIPLFRGGAISGRVIDAYGDPVENASVQAVFVPPPSRSGASARGAMRSSQSTNDIGEFRLGRLEPGQYYLLVMPERRGWNSPDDLSTAPGRTWYPGVASIDQAQAITLERGASFAGADFQMLETTLTKVTGFVLNGKGAPAKNGHITARTTSATKGMPAGWGGGGGPDAGGSGLDQNGNFDLLLQPGEYVLEAMAPQGEDGGRQGRMEMDRGQVRLVVGGEAISGVTIVTGTGGTVSGRFVFKGTAPPPTSFAGFNVGFGGPNGAGMGEDCRAFTRPAVNPDGTFSVENMWGACVVRGGGAAKGWTFESVMHNGNDITNRPIEFTAGRSISGVEIVYSDRVADLTLTVADERGAPSEEYVAIVFPVDKERWGDQRFLRTQVMSPKTNLSPNGPSGYSQMRIASNSIGPSAIVSSEMFGGGTGSIRGMLAGDYFALAIDDAALEDLRDPEYLERLSQMATRVSLSPGAAQSVQLRRVKAPE
jgi:hypothetical protein